MSGGKLFVLATWIVAIAVAWQSSGWLAAIGQITLVLLIVSHPIESLLLRDYDWMARVDRKGSQRWGGHGCSPHAGVSGRVRPGLIEPPTIG